jgi:hypothetical protein
LISAYWGWISGFISVLPVPVKRSHMILLTICPSKPRFLPDKGPDRGDYILDKGR